MSADRTPLHLHAAFKSYAHTEKIISGELTTPGIVLDCEEVEPIYRAFAPMARKQVYDVSEMAIVTYLQAKAYNKPLILLPTVVAARLQQGCLIYNARRRPFGIADLPGAKVGVRAYTQTTGMWVRAILAGTYGVPTEKIQWITFEEGHLAEYVDPPFATRAPAGKNMLQMLMDGEIDCAIFGNDLPQDEFIKPVVPDPVAADKVWYEKHKFIPINHTAVVTRAVAERNPDAVKAVYRLLKQAKADAGGAGLRKKLPDGIDTLRGPLEMILAFCEEQRLLPRKLTVDEIFADCLEFLGDEAH